MVDDRAHREFWFIRGDDEGYIVEARRCNYRSDRTLALWWSKPVSLPVAPVVTYIWSGMPNQADR